MKFSLVLLLVASVTAIQRSDPAGAYKNFKDGLVVADKVVAKQKADEAKLEENRFKLYFDTVEL